MATRYFHKVFVYGTLKKGEPNHETFTKSDGGHYKFLCDAETVAKYPLIIATKYNIPFLLYEPGVGLNVKGEVYEVDDLVMKALDKLEDHPNFYIRELDMVKSLKDDVQLQTWIYFIKSFKKELLERPKFRSYSDEGEHGLKYVARYLRDPTYRAKGDVTD